MSNVLNDKKSSLSTISYQVIYDAIRSQIKDLNIVPDDKNEGNIYFATNLTDICNKITKSLYRKLKNDFFAKMEMDETAIRHNFVTLNFKNKEKEHQKLKELMREMTRLLERKKIEPKTNQLNEIIVEDASNIKSDEFSVQAEKREYSVDIERLAYNDFPQAGEKRIRQDYVTISYRVDHLMEEIKSSLIRFFQDHPDVDELEKEFVIDQIKKENMFAQEIYDFIEENRFAAIKRTASFLYLDYLLEKIYPDFRKKNRENVNWLKRYIERHELFEEACTQFLKENRYPMPVDILGEERNLLDSLRKKEVFDVLPVIGNLSSLMVATTDYEKSIEQYGISLKLNGVVHNSKFPEGEGKPSFSYQIEKVRDNLKNGSNFDKFKTNKKAVNAFWYSVIDIAVMKYFLLGLDDEKYDPLATLKEDLDHIYGFHGNSFEDMYAWYRELAESLLNRKEEIKEIEKQLDAVRKMLIQLLHGNLKNKEVELASRTYKRRLVFLKSILADKLLDPTRTTIFRNELNTHNYRYIILAKEILKDSLFSFEFEVEFHTNFLCSTQQKMEIKGKYCVEEDDETIAVMFVPYEPNKRKLGERVKVFTSQSTSIKKVIIQTPYIKKYKSPLHKFLYLLVYKLLVYIFLVGYTSYFEDKGKRLFIAFWHLHEQGKDDTELDSRQFSKELEFLLAMNFSTGSQGYIFGKDNNNNYKIVNAKKSMYANVPQKFQMTVPIQTPKMAIVIITSMKSDDHYQCDQYRTGIFGEVYVIDSEDNTSIFRRYRTFFDHDDEEVFQRSDVLVSVMKQLYDDGYKDVIYIAKVPYTMKFLKKKDNEMELYFMNAELLKSMQISDDMSIYPMHYTITKVFEAPHRKKKQGAFFVDNTSHIQKNLYKDHQGIVPILQLYSGKDYPMQKKHKVYNSLITYQTWSRIYPEEIILNNKIQTAVIAPDGKKKDIIRALLMLHSVRYESSFGNTIKVNPYDRLLDDDGVAKKSKLEVIVGDKMFKSNILAYFSYIQTKVFDMEREEE